jgi:hypothetical protein
MCVVPGLVASSFLSLETTKAQALAIALMEKALGLIAGGRLELPTPAL